MPFEDWDKFDNDDEDELEDDSWMQGKRDAVLFAIECSESMLKMRDDGQGNQKCHLQITLEGCRDIMKRKAAVAPNDYVGILVFNTAEKVDSTGGKSGEIKNYCHVYRPLEQINAPKIQELNELLDDAKEDPSTLRDFFPPKSGDHVPMGDVFTSCNWMIRDGAPNTGVKRLFLITDNDDPHPGQPQLFKTAQNTMFDLRQMGVLIQTFFISTDEHPFKISKFYSTVINAEVDEAEIVDSVTTSFGSLLGEMKFKEALKRSLWSIPLHLGEGFTIGVKGYGLVTEQKKLGYTYRSNAGREQAAVMGRPMYKDEELGVEVDKSAVVYGMSLGAKQDDDEDETKGAARVANRGAKVFYNGDEVREFRTLGMQPGLKLLGFKDLSELTIEDNVKHSLFIYPDESAYSGSTRTFAALLKSMHKKKKLGLVLGLLRRNSSPAFYAMLAQVETEKNGEIEPNGFHLIQLPFADDIRAAPFEKAVRAEEEVKDAAVAVIEKLKIKNGRYNADDNPNPALQLHYAQLEALAFNDEFDKDNVDDFTAPPTDIIQKRAGQLILKWRQAIDNDESSHLHFATGKTPAKRKPTEAVDESEIRSRYDGGTLSKLTNDQLKEFLRSKSLSVGGKKAELLERIGDWLDKH